MFLDRASDQDLPMREMSTGTSAVCGTLPGRFHGRSLGVIVVSHAFLQRPDSSVARSADEAVFFGERLCVLSLYSDFRNAKNRPPIWLCIAPSSVSLRSFIENRWRCCASTPEVTMAMFHRALASDPYRALMPVLCTLHPNHSILLVAVPTRKSAGKAWKYVGLRS